jgi:GMP synthase (glutamine-hydrolysing)
MGDGSQTGNLAALFKRTGEAHHEACAATDGEEKRKCFISNYKKLSDQHIREIGADWIADGTIAPDISETEGGFKSQHNVGWNYTLRKLEPLASLAKPQVRKVGEYLGLPASFTHRIPCPGPEQIVRSVGLFTEEKLRVSPRNKLPFWVSSRLRSLSYF